MANEPWPIMQDYDKNIGKDEVARVTLTSGKKRRPVDPFSITLTPKGAGATLTLARGATRRSRPRSRPASSRVRRVDVPYGSLSEEGPPFFHSRLLAR
jgi:hypothetical protein